MFSQDIQRLRLDAVAVATELHLCAGRPVTLQDLTANSLGSVAIDPETDATITYNAGSQKFVLVVAQKQITYSKSGRRTHYALSDGVAVLHTGSVAQADVLAAVVADVAGISIAD